MEKATFAGGCFWCMEPCFRIQKGVEAVVSGYLGGGKKNPTYEQVCMGTTGHIEAVKITFDPQKISYSKLLDIFWQNHDPTDLEGQFADRGSQYKPAIFYHNEEQRRSAESSKEALDLSGKFSSPIVTEILPAATFYPAEEYHQNYAQKNALHYKMYRMGSGRQEFLDETWGPSVH